MMTLEPYHHHGAVHASSISIPNNRNKVIAGTPKHSYQVGEQEYWFYQRIDHFNALNTDTFPQRFYKYVPPGVSPESPNHILYICPEGKWFRMKYDEIFPYLKLFKINT